MKVNPTSLADAVLVEADIHTDERGSFMRTFAAEVWDGAGLDSDVVHCNVSNNPVAGSLRGLHFQVDPWAEAKSVHCIRGLIWDVIVDLRPDSPTFMQWEGFHLAPGTTLFVPEGFAHGFQTLEADSTILYLMSAPYHPEAQRGIRFDDPRLGIEWPVPVTIMSDRDRTLPLLEEISDLLS